MANKNSLLASFLSAIAMIVGTCVGAGIFGLPYVISKIGVTIGILYIIILGFITLVVCLAYGEIVLRTNGKHQFPEYARIYLGPAAKKIAFASLAIGFYGALIAYLMEVSNFLQTLLSPYLGGSLNHYLIFYFLFVSLAIFLGLGMIAKLEKVLMFIMLGIVCLLIIFGVPKIVVTNLSATNLNYLFLPYGVILFALSCSSAIPDMKNILADKKEKLKKAIIIGIIIPMIVYIVFSLIIVGICGGNTSESAILGLQNSLGNKAMVVGLIFGCITMTTSFLTVGLVLKEVYMYDFKVNKILAWIAVVLPPLFIVLMNFVSFIEIIGLAGALIGGIDGILIIKMFRKSKQIGQRKPEYELKVSSFFTYLLYAVFILGIFYEIYILFNETILS